MTFLFRKLRQTGARALLLGTAMSLALSAPAAAQFLPSGFFDTLPATSSAPAAISADTLTFDSAARIIIAEGGVEMQTGGFTLRGDRLVFNQGTGDVSFVGNVEITNPSGTVYTTDGLQLTGGMKQAFLSALTVTALDGTRITAADARYEAEVRTILEEASYSPCGDCIDDKGRRIGWQVRASRMVYDNETKMVELVDPTLALLGFPVAWLPYLSFPDPSQFSDTGFQAPSIDYGDKIGFKVTVPYAYSPSYQTSFIFMPTLVTRQGFLMDAQWVQRFSGGITNLRVNGIYQLDPGAFAGTVGDTQWRGSIQTSGRFTPAENWLTGWSYTAFTDAAYLPDYRIASGYVTNEVFATHLTREVYFDARLQEFRQLGNYTEAHQERQARVLPLVRYNSIFELGEERGRISVSAKLLGVRRGTDDSFLHNGVLYSPGLAGNKTHLSAEAAYETQWIGPGGVVVSPYLGLRGDAAYYDGASPLMPGATSLLAFTPIAALDIRWPLIAAGWGATHLVEPIAQIVYRGSDTTLVGITNDDAQSFVFDDTNLFSFNRFSGRDRQETGLRVNVGGHYQASLANGGYIDLLAGQSFHLAGVNGLGVVDHAQTGNATGLENLASYIVAGAKTHVIEDLEVGGKVALDPNTWTVARAGLGAYYLDDDGYSLTANYIFLPATPSRGVLVNQQEISAGGQVPIFDYWRLRAGGAWDLTANSWLEARAGFGYDDGYLLFGVDAAATGPTHSTPNDRRITASFRLKTASGAGVGLDNVGFGF